MPDSVLIGRDEELAELRFLLEIEPVVGIVGPPGSGKTALAQALHAKVWVDLEGCCTRSDYTAALSTALGCANGHVETLRFALQPHEIIVLDGVDEGFDWLEDLLNLGPQIGWVLTSRRHLSCAGSQIELGPLAAVDGAQLLLRRVKSARRRDELETEGLERLSEAVDGLPGALVLMAPRLRLYDPGALLERAPSLHPLDLAMRSLVDDLDDGVRQVLEVAAQLPGSFTADTLDTAVGRSSEMALLTLLQSALVHAESGARFRVLRPLRAVILERPGPTQAVLGRLASPLLKASELALARGTGAALSVLISNRPLLEALTKSADADVVWRTAVVLCRLHRLRADMEALLEVAEGLPAEGPSELRVRIACMAADAHRLRGRPQEGLRALRAVADCLTPATRSAHQVMEAALSAVTGDLQGAHERAEAALGPDAPAHLWRRLGAIRFDRGDTEGGMEAYRRALTTDDPLERFQAHASLANAMLELHLPESEIRAELQAVDLDAAPAVRGVVLAIGAFLHARAGQVQRAHDAFLAAAEATRDIGYLDGAATRWIWAQIVRFIDGDIPEVLIDPTALRSPLRERGRALDSLSCLALHRGWSAVVHLALGHVDAGHALWAETRPVLQAYSPRSAEDLACVVAVVLHGTDPDRAQALLAPLPDTHIAQVARALLRGESVDTNTLEERLLVGVASIQARRIAVDVEGRGFRNGMGVWVDISRRKVLARMLATLAAAQAPLDVEALCAAVWPEERLVGNSGTRRVHVAISTLRGLGLRDVLHTVEGPSGTGWQLVAPLTGTSESAPGLPASLQT